jgi:tetratricopeptide (TPR) repeat protein
VAVLRRDDKPRTLESLTQDLLTRFPSGKVNAAIKSAIAYVTNPQELASTQSSSRYSFPSYYMARYYLQSLAFSTAHTYILKALAIEKDSALQLHYLLTFEEICRKCSCSLPHDYDRRILPLVRKASESQKAQLLKTLGEHFLKFDQERRGLRLLEAYLDAVPYDHGTRFDCAYQYAQLGEIGLAIHHYSILASHPEDSERYDRVLNNLGASYDGQGMPGMALRRYREAYALGNTLAGANIAAKYIGVGMFDEAKSHLDEIVVSHPKTYDENVALHLGNIVTTRHNEENKSKELETLGAFLSSQYVEAVRALVSDNQFSWVGTWSFGDMGFVCSEDDGDLVVSLVVKVSGELKASVDGNCLEISSYKRPYETIVRTGIFYLTSDNTFNGYLITENGKFESVTGTRAAG